MTTKLTIEPSQCRAARGLLAWTQADLANRAGVTLPTISDFENEKRTPHQNNLAAIRRALEDAGVKFITAGKNGGPGVRMKS